MTRPIFDSRDSACKTPFGAVPTGREATFTVHLPKTLPVDAVWLRIFPIDHWEQSELIPMPLCGADLVANSCRCSFRADTPAVYVYHFEVHTANGAHTILRGPDRTGILGDGGLWQHTVYDPAMRTPACLREGVMYQIFPDRFFCSGAPKENVPADRLLRDDWGGIPVWQPNGQGEVTNSDYFGGDLEGIAQKLEYLVSLGVRVLYLNPVFEAHSNHRYNTADYRSIDPLLGDNEAFRVLCEEAGRRGIAVILDGVFSHTGSDSVYFNKEKRYGDGGAYNDPESPYRSWYRFTRYPDEYESWWGFPTLPNVDEANPDYLDFICGGDGVLPHWLRLGASGFRLDVADELPDVFLDRLYSCVKGENPDAAVIGEVWEDASNKVSYGIRRRYLLGSQMDSVMNYPFKDALLHYIRHGGGHSFYNTVMDLLENYPPPVLSALMNSLSTHDTARALTVLGGEPLGEQGREWQEARHHLSAEEYRQGKRLLILAMILQYGLPGLPCVYYGDEAGLCGYKDPFNRTCYPWGGEDHELLHTARALGAIRRDYPVFYDGAFLPLLFDDQVCAFTREKAGQTLLFAVNRSGQAQSFPLPNTGKTDVLFAHGEYSPGRLGAFSGVVLRWRE